MIYDISVPIRNSMHVWPSDPPVELEDKPHLARDRSHTILTTSIKCGSHTGTHMDAPSHMIKGGMTLSEMSLEQLVGPAHVVEISGARSIQKKHVQDLDWEKVERVLFKTDNSLHWQDEFFYEEFVYLEPDAAVVLAEHGIRLVGIDYLSIDRYQSEGHPTHFVLLGESIVILEGLNLTGVPTGEYQLIALPLKLHQGDGAPVRAILIN